MNGVSLKGGMPYLARLIVASLAFICLLPQRFFGSLGTGLDASWQLALHMAVDAGRVFGRDFLFTYGPLGVLSTRLPFDSSYLLLLAFDLFFYGFLLYAFWRLCQRLETAIQYGILCAVCFFAGELVYGADLVIALFGLCLLFLYLFEESGRWLDFLLACLLAIVIFYVKLNMGFAVLLCVVGVLCSIAVDAHRRLRAAIGVIVFIALLSASTLLVRVDLDAYNFL